jgi:Lrp/AsnC family leucine-responsive transcriptional regulator
VTSAASLDEIDIAILRALREDARLPLNQLARRVALSRPATTERVRRLERRGVITGYRAQVDLPMIGRPVLAYVRVRAPDADAEAIDRLIDGTPQIIEWHHVSGEDCFVTMVAAADLEELESVVGELATLGQTITSIVFSTRLRDRVEVT